MKYSDDTANVDLSNFILHYQAEVEPFKIWMKYNVLELDLGGKQGHCLLILENNLLQFHLSQ